MSPTSFPLKHYLIARFGDVLVVYIENKKKLGENEREIYDKFICMLISLQRKRFADGN